MLDRLEKKKKEKRKQRCKNIIKQKDFVPGCYILKKNFLLVLGLQMAFGDSTLK